MNITHEQISDLLLEIANKEIGTQLQSDITKQGISLFFFYVLPPAPPVVHNVPTFLDNKKENNKEHKTSQKTQ